MTHCADGLAVDGNLAALVKLALEYEVVTGRSGMDFTPTELVWRVRVMSEREKLNTFSMARAVAVGMSGDEKAWKTLE